MASSASEMKAIAIKNTGPVKGRNWSIYGIIFTWIKHAYE